MATTTSDAYNFCHNAPPKDFFSTMQSINQMTQQVLNQLLKIWIAY